MKKRENKKIIIIVVAILLLCIVGIVAYLFFKDDGVSNGLIGSDKPGQEKVESISGKERINAQAEIVDIIKKYVDNNKNILQHAKNNKLVSISIKDLKEDFKIDITEFESLSYNCDSSKKNIKFKDNYSNYYITLNC